MSDTAIARLAGVLLAGFMATLPATAWGATVTVDGVPGAAGATGGDADAALVAATDAYDYATANGGSGGTAPVGAGGSGGNATAGVSNPDVAGDWYGQALATGGSGGNGGSGGATDAGGRGGDATASVLMSRPGGYVSGTANATGGAGGSGGDGAAGGDGGAAVAQLTFAATAFYFNQYPQLLARGGAGGDGHTVGGAGGSATVTGNFEFTTASQPGSLSFWEGSRVATGGRGGNGVAGSNGSGGAGGNASGQVALKVGAYPFSSGAATDVYLEVAGGDGGTAAGTGTGGNGGSATGAITVQGGVFVSLEDLFPGQLQLTGGRGGDGYNGGRGGDATAIDGITLVNLAARQVAQRASGGRGGDASGGTAGAGGDATARQTVSSAKPRILTVQNGAGAGHGGSGTGNADGATGGTATAVSRATNGGDATAIAHARGGDGGHAEFGDAGDGGGVQLVVAGQNTHAQSTTGTARAEVLATGGNGGSVVPASIYPPYDPARNGAAGDGAEVLLQNAASGASASGGVVLVQGAYGGAGGNSVAGLNGRGGTATSILDFVATGLSVHATTRALGGSGGERLLGQGLLAGAGDAVATTVISGDAQNVVGAAQAFGGDSGAAYGGGQAADGGASTATADVSSSYAGDGLVMARAGMTDDQWVYWRAQGGFGIGGGLAGDGGAGTATATALSNGHTQTIAQANAQGGRAGAGQDANYQGLPGLDGRGGDAVATATAGKLAGAATTAGVSLATATAQGGYTGGASDTGLPGGAGSGHALAIAHAYGSATNQAEANAYGGQAQLLAEAGEATARATGTRALANARSGAYFGARLGALADIAASEANAVAEGRTTIGGGGPGRDGLAGLDAGVFATMLPDGAEFAALLGSNLEAAAAFSGGFDPATAGIALFGMAASGTTAARHLEATFTVDPTGRADALAIALLDPEFDGAGFGSLRLEIQKYEGLVDFQSLEYLFTSLNEALSFFDDQVLIFERLHPEEELGLRFIVDYAGTGGSDGFRFNAGFASPVPAPPGVLLLASGLAGLVVRAARRSGRGKVR